MPVLEQSIINTNWLNVEIETKHEYDMTKMTKWITLEDKNSAWRRKNVLKVHLQFNMSYCNWYPIQLKYNFNVLLCLFYYEFEKATDWT